MVLKKIFIILLKFCLEISVSLNFFFNEFKSNRNVYLRLNGLHYLVKAFKKRETEAGFNSNLRFLIVNDLNLAYAHIARHSFRETSRNKVEVLENAFRNVVV